MTDEPTPRGGRARRGQAPTACVCPQCGYEDLPKVRNSSHGKVGRTP